MTAAHTPGTLTATPTAGHETHGQSALAADSCPHGRDVAILYGREPGDTERMALCWNALQHLDNDAVERLGRSLERYNSDELRDLLADEGF